MFETEKYRVELIYVEDLGECRRIIFGGNYDKPWFAGIDIARCLGYSNPNDVIYKLIKDLGKDHVKRLFPLETIKSMKTLETDKLRDMVYNTTIIDVYGMNILLIKTIKTDLFRKILANIADKFKSNPSLYSKDYIL